MHIFHTKRCGALVLAIAMLLCLALSACGVDQGPTVPGNETTASGNETVPSTDPLSVYQEKNALLKAAAMTEAVAASLGDAPAGDAGFVVFHSITDRTERAHVFTGTGKTLEKAWQDAEEQAVSFLKKNQMMPVWVKADVVCESAPLTPEKLTKEVYAARHEFYRYGLAFDSKFNLALLEAELNGAKIYEYENGGVDYEYLNLYLKKAGRDKLKKEAKEYVKFQCLSWFCDEDLAVYELDVSGLTCGRRQIELIDDEFVYSLLDNASEFLMDQVNEDGTFIYGMYPRFDNDIENYNILRHAGTIWSLVCRYRLEPNPELEEKINHTIDYLLTQIRYADENTGYLYESKNNEIKLGGNGVAIVTLTEYMNVFGNEKYADVCRKLGNGILSMMDQETGCYYHVLNGDFTRKEEYRTVYYDGEATFALARLYSLTGEQVWLDAAMSAVDHFIEADYTQHKDHWVAYAINEVTKYVDSEEYYNFGLLNAQNNLVTIRDRDTTYHTYLELLMVTFELYDRMVQKGMSVDAIDLELFLETIYVRADRMLNGYFFPEYAMYMRNPQRIVNTFMVRHDGYRTRIDDVQHNIGAYYMYYKNYDKLVDYGLLDVVAQIDPSMFSGE